MLFDWQWYMPCTSHDGDATQVVDKVDMQRVVDYGRERRGRVALREPARAYETNGRTVPLLSSWGVAGVKSGFVQYASHRWAVWLLTWCAAPPTTG